jgi:hypothetical protein
MFEGIIFVEKIWSKGIYVSKATGIFFMIISVLVLIGTVSIMPEDEKMNSLYEMESMNMSNSNPDKRNDLIDNTMNMNMKISK